MRCRRFNRKLPLFVGGELSLEERNAAEKHLRICSVCRGELEAYSGDVRRLSDLAGEMWIPVFTDREWQGLMDGVKSRLEKKEIDTSSGGRGLQILAPAVITAAALLMAGWVGLRVLRDHGTEADAPLPRAEISLEQSVMIDNIDQDIDAVFCSGELIDLRQVRYLYLFKEK